MSKKRFDLIKGFILRGQQLLIAIGVITAGHASKSPTDLLPSHRMDQLLPDLSEVYDLIIIDAPRSCYP